jgi:hypothetical protein
MACAKIAEQDPGNLSTSTRLRRNTPRNNRPSALRRAFGG